MKKPKFVRLDIDNHTTAKILSAYTGKTIEEIVNTTLRRYLKQAKKKKEKNQ